MSLPPKFYETSEKLFYFSGFESNQNNAHWNKIFSKFNFLMIKYHILHSVNVFRKKKYSIRENIRHFLLFCMNFSKNFLIFFCLFCQIGKTLIEKKNFQNSISQWSSSIFSSLSRKILSDKILEWGKYMSFLSKFYEI